MDGPNSVFELGARADELLPETHDVLQRQRGIATTDGIPVERDFRSAVADRVHTKAAVATRDDRDAFAAAKVDVALPGRARRATGTPAWGALLVITIPVRDPPDRCDLRAECVGSQPIRPDPRRTKERVEFLNDRTRQARRVDVHAVRTHR